jgi:hypothetical protein
MNEILDAEDLLVSVLSMDGFIQANFLRHLADFDRRERIDNPESARISLPALKPYHPNHSSPVPSATSGMLCGPRSRTRRLPTYKTDARAAKPAML